MIVDIFIPCFIDQLYPQTGFNMVKVLERAGCDVNYNPEQTCCGQPAFNAGYWDEAKKVGEKFIKEFNNDRYIVSPSASCVGMIKNYYPEMFHNAVLHNEYKQIAKNIHEFSSFLVNVPATLGNSSAYIGLTGGDGDLPSVQTVTNFLYSYTTPPIISLNAHGTPGQVVVSWPVSVSTLFTLMQSSSLTGPWTPAVPVSSAVAGLQNQVTLSAGRAAGFYKLQLIDPNAP